VYVVTFYSFKGGVGRTMALVNLGAELARSGRKVLLVDFDLEAPGLETFQLLKSHKQTPGIVEYVSAYLNSGQSPDVGDYVYEVTENLPGAGGQLWIMPSGRQDDSYGRRLSSIDWQELYSRHEGYLLFEDLKLQWKKAFDPDYVLIDSRTGHTDVSGICTRQLPDAVVVLFFPNEQNLQGLTKVIQNIRREASGARRKNILLHFVTSNIPDLDDEDQILERRMAKFRNDLGYKNLAGTIHHYDSLALLNQVVFTQERPRSRLAREYRLLLRTIARSNPQDREGALEFLREFVSRAPGETSTGDLAPVALTDRLRAIEAFHPNDGAILYHLALIREQEGRPEDAAALLDKAIATGYDEPDAFLRRAELLGASPEFDANQILSYVRRVLKMRSRNVGHFGVQRAIRWLRKLDPGSLSELPDMPAFAELDGDSKFAAASDLTRDPLLAQTAIRLFAELAHDAQASSELRSAALVQQTILLIGAGRPIEAMRAISPERPEAASLRIYDAFNYAMAEWALTGQVPHDLLSRVIQIDREEPARRSDANYEQCLAMAFWLTGDVDEARRRLAHARGLLAESGQDSFSGWRYRMASPHEFQADLDALERGMEGETVLPRFISEWQAHPSRYAADQN
jgi:MinD-like ATPase involved in chromosome partitioning or flagellar assembly